MLPIKSYTMSSVTPPDAESMSKAAPETDTAAQSTHSDDREGPNSDQSVANVFSERSGSYYEDNYAGNAANPNAFLKQHRKAFILALAGNRHEVALELGCGPAVLTEELAGLGKSVVALDISQEMVVAGRDRIKQGGRDISFCTGRCQGLPFLTESFGQIFAAGVLEYLPDLEDGLGELDRILKPGGQVIASFPVHRIWYEKLAEAATPWIPTIRMLLGSSRGRSTANPRLKHNFPHHRFRPKSLRRRLGEAGWELEVAQYHHFVFFPLDVISPPLTAVLDRFLSRNLPRFLRPYLAKSVVLLLRKKPSS